MKQLFAFLNGMREFRSSFTTHYPETLEESYGWGREIAHRLTLRKFEESH
ncbi:hypothetical protein AAKU61_004240 [Undibacterium sp. GrIS 1.2]